MSDSCDPMDCSPPGSSVFLGKNTGVGCHFLLQGIFLTQESNQGLLHCRQILYQLSYQGSSCGLLFKALCFFLYRKYQNYHILFLLKSFFLSSNNQIKLCIYFPESSEIILEFSLLTFNCGG